MFGEVPEVVHSAVVNTLDTLEEKDKKLFRLPKIAVACFVCVLVSGITVSAMGVISQYRQRMEGMNEELLEAYYSYADAGEATSFSRSYTSEEETRYEQLKEEYENNGLFPTEQITCLQNEEEYSGEGIALNTANRTLYLPEKELTDEELLEIIDFDHKITYSIYEQQEEKIANGSDWESRMAEMDDNQVDEIYLAIFSGNSEISGAHNRDFSETENARYQELVKGYEEDGMFATSELAVIQTPEEYTKEGIALCSSDSTFYFPDRELTDEEMLQLIDFEHKVTYCLDRINQEINLGLRTEYPHK